MLQFLLWSSRHTESSNLNGALDTTGSSHNQRGVHNSGLILGEVAYNKVEVVVERKLNFPLYKCVIPTVPKKCLQTYKFDNSPVSRSLCSRFSKVILFVRNLKLTIAILRVKKA